MANVSHVSVPKVFASGDATEWFKRFDICSAANGWNDAAKAAKLPTLLDGEALTVWLELDEDVQKDYKGAKQKIVDVLMPTEFVTLDKFHNRSYCKRPVTSTSKVSSVTLVAESGSVHPMANVSHVSVPKVFASGDATEWFKRFDICSAANGWNDAAKAAKLPTLLDGEALAVWLELDEDVQKDYKGAKQKIVDVLMPTEFVTLDKFHNRRLLPGEALSVFVHDLKKLLSLAMPGIEANAKDQLLLHQLMAGLPTSITKQLRASGEIKNFNDTVQRARLLLSIEEQHNGITMETPADLSHANATRMNMAERTDDVATTVLEMIVDLWITVRGFSLAGAWVEEFKITQKKTTQKSKALRKQLK
ncbi:hypothetical protein EMCRGX_G014404 [Ephydatia muelleri]|eukprot:Em0005g1514a